MNQTDLWNQVNARLDYGFLIVLIIAMAVVIARWAVGPSRRLSFDRLTLGMSGGVMTIALVALWFK